MQMTQLIGVKLEEVYKFLPFGITAIRSENDTNGKNQKYLTYAE